MVTNEIRPVRIAIALILAILANYLPVQISVQAHTVMAITTLIGLLWLLEAMPLHVTALLVPVLLIVFGGIGAKEAFYPFFDPVIVIFFGGFVLARAMHKHQLDEEIAYGFIARLGRDSRVYILGVMVITAFLSFWISNTAAAAIMLPIAMVALAKSGLKPLKSNYGKAVALGVCYAATIGGMATLVGTPPNGIVVSNLAKAGITVTFLDWMWFALPFVVLFLPIAWLVLVAVFKPEIRMVEFERRKLPFTREHKLVLAVGALTILLWVTSGFHRVPDSAVALVPVILLYLLGLLETKDISLIEWSALLLFGGGLSLGAAIDSSGLGGHLGSLLGGLAAGQPYPLVLLIVVLFAIFLTLSASNTATAALMAPIVIPLASVLGFSVRNLAIIAGLGTSLDFILPVGTPPSAIAYSSGYVRVGDMVKAGVLITLLGAVLLTLLAYLYW